MSHSADDLMERLASSQLGLVTRRQLRQHGIAPDVIDRRFRCNRLHPLHRGVYQVGPLLVPYARELAAVLACGPHAVLSHQSAGWLWRLLPDPHDLPVQVILRKGDGRRPGIQIHRVSIETADVTSLNGITVTSPSRTLVDLAALLERRELERALAQADRLDLLDRRKLLALTDSRNGRPGAPLLRSLLDHAAEPALTRSEAEERFLALIRKAQLPDPECNKRVADYEVDFLWRREQLVVEVDGFAFHSSHRRFESDRLRDARLTAHGLHVVRVTWQQLVKEPVALVARLAHILARHSA